MVNDYVGLYHYSRGLDVTDERIQMLANAGVDVVLPFPCVTGQALVSRMTQYWDELYFEVFSNVCPDYLPSLEKYFLNRLFFAGNIVFAKKSIYCRYYEWMFRVLDEFGRLFDKKGRQVEARLWGYVGESLTGIYFMHYIDEYNIVYAKLISMF